MAESKTVSVKTTKTSPNRKRSLEQFLVDEGYLTKKQVADLHMQQARDRKSLEDAIVKLGFLDMEKFTRAKAEFFRLPYVDLRLQQISKEALQAISKETLANYQIMPFAKEQNVLKVALIDPTDLRALEALEFLAQQHNLRIELYLASRGSYNAALQKSQTITTEVGEALEDIKEETIESAEVLKEKGKDQAVEDQTLAPEAPISKIVDVVIRHAIEAKASDIHIEPQENDLRIRYRVDGILRSSLVVPKMVHAGIVSRIKILSNLKIDEQRLPQDGRFHMDVDQHSIDFRVSTLPTVNGEKVVMRILDKSGGVPTLEELGFSGLKLARLKDSIKKSHGMLLVTGPTGSGKSTTLYAVLNIINQIGVNIVTLEDPVEYFIPGVNQSQVNPDIGLTFASGLRSILRQDPNIIMVGEIRDKETAELAVHSALTGHLVFSTLHTNDSLGAVPRLLDMGIEAFLLTASLDAVVGQRLVRKICQDCRQEKELTAEVKELITKNLTGLPKGEGEGVDLKNIKIYEGKGCKECAQSGYRGRLGIFELLPVSPKIKELILNHQSGAELKKQAVSEGMITMMQDGLIKVVTGQTTIEEVLRVTKE